MQLHPQQALRLGRAFFRVETPPFFTSVNHSCWGNQEPRCGSSSHEHRRPPKSLSAFITTELAEDVLWIFPTRLPEVGLCYFLLKCSNKNSSEVAGCTSLCTRHPGMHLKSQTSRSDLNWGYLLRHRFNMELLLCFYCNDQLRISTSETSGGWFTGSKQGPGQATLLERPAPACCARVTPSPWCRQGGLPCVWLPSTEPSWVPGMNCEQGSC